MKKEILSFAILTMILASCSTNEVDEVVSGNNSSNAINFMTSTTKASINTKEQLKHGFTVYASNAASLTHTTPAWYLSGQTYKFDAGVWKWDPTGTGYQTAWPAAGTDNYPLTFAAYYPQSPDGFTPTASVTGGIASLKAEITVQTPTVSGGVVTTNQVDYLAAKQEASVKPLNGFLALDFNHIMSKINAAIIPGNGTNVKVQKLAFNGMTKIFEYEYLQQGYAVGPDPTTITNFTYFDKATATADADKSMNFLGADVNEGTATPFYSTNTANNLMLSPMHAGETWTPVSGTAPTYDKALIEVIYRITDNATPAKDLIGFTKAEDAPGYDNTNLAHTALAGQPLFIKVGFPLPTTNGTESSWQAGKGYSYKIKLGTADASGGNYIDGVYYDKDGNKTEIPITDGNGKPVNPGDPVANGTIGFIVNVTDWATDADVIIGVKP